MCLTIDTCCLGNVLNPSDKEHSEFKPVLNWIRKGGGKVIYGGTKYNEELRKAIRYLGILVELSKSGRAIKLDDREVDQIQKEVEKKANNPKFDDPHIVAMVIVSRCRIVCTNDTRAHPFLTLSDLYPKNVLRPKIYSNYKCAHLLNDQNIVGVCVRS